MAYRFTDTEKWKDQWFVDLDSNQKLMFMYMCDNCDIAGFFELSVRKMAFDLSMTDSEIKGAFKGLSRGLIISDDKSIAFVKNFIKHQKNLPLNPENKAHIGILKRFELYKSKYSIDLLEAIKQGAFKGLQSPLGIGIDKGEGKVTNEPLIKNIGVDFEIFWNLYDKKVGDKSKCLKKWNKLTDVIQKKIIEELPKWKNQFEEKQFQPHPETYLNQQRWNDELILPLKTPNPQNASKQPIQPSKRGFGSL